MLAGAKRVMTKERTLKRAIRDATETRLHDIIRAQPDELCVIDACGGRIRHARTIGHAAARAVRQRGDRRVLRRLECLDEPFCVLVARGLALVARALELALTELDEALRIAFRRAQALRAVSAGRLLLRSFHLPRLRLQLGRRLSFALLLLLLLLRFDALRFALPITLGLQLSLPLLALGFFLRLALGRRLRAAGAGVTLRAHA